MTDSLLQQIVTQLTNIADDRLQVYAASISVVGVVVAMISAWAASKAAKSAEAAVLGNMRPMAVPSDNRSHYGQTKDKPHSFYFRPFNRGLGPLFNLTLIGIKLDESSPARTSLKIDEDEAYHVDETSFDQLVQDKYIRLAYKDIYGRWFVTLMALDVDRSANDTEPTIIVTGEYQVYGPFKTLKKAEKGSWRQWLFQG